MFHLYSKGCEYAIQAMMNVSRLECRDGFSVRSVCLKAGLPESFTRKTFQTLVKKGLLAAKRGPGGGYRFSKDPAKITLLNVIYAIDGKDAFDKCVVKNKKCEHRGHCSLHPMWAKTREKLMKELKDSTVAEVLQS